MQPVWPDDADGDVLRRIQASGFDFKREVEIDFIVDFAAWPPAGEAIASIRARHARLKMHAPDATGSGYVRFVVRASLTYELVMDIQRSVSALVAPFGGVCESWGVLH